MPSIHEESLLRHAGFVRALALRLLGDEGRADDVTQETMLTALNRAPQRVESPRAWLARVSHRLSMRSLRTQRRARRREEVAAVPEAQPSSAEVVEHQSTLQQVTESVLALPDGYQQVVLLHFYESLTPTEIAERLGVPVKTVYTRLRRALDRLRRTLDDRNDGSRRAWAMGLASMLGDREAPPNATPAPSSGAAGLAGSMIIKRVAAILLSIGGACWWAPWESGSTPARHEGISSPRAGAFGSFEGTPSTTRAEAAAEMADRSLPADSRSTIDGPATKAGLEIEAIWKGTGRPVRERTLQLLPFDGLVTPVPKPFGIAGFVAFESQPIDVRTDSEGLSVVDLAAGHYLLFDPLARRSDPIELRQGETLRHRFEIDVGVTVTGRVFGPSGSKVSGANVWVSSWTSEDVGAVAVRTDSSGEFQLLGVSPGSAIGGRAPGFGASRLQDVEGVDGSSLRVRIDLEESVATLEGVIYDAQGLPLEDARVGVRSRWQPKEHRADGVGLRRRVPIETLSDRYGRFRLAAVTPGEVIVTVAAGDHASWADSLNVEEGEVHPLSIQLGHGVSVSGRILDASGEPLPGAELIVHEPLDPVARRSRADAEGRYQFARIPRGSTVHALKEGVGDCRWTLPHDATDALAWDLVLSPGRVVRGRLVNQAGLPLVGRWLHALVDTTFEAEGVPWTATAATDSGGEFEFLGCPRAEIQLTVLVDRTPGEVVLWQQVPRDVAEDLRITIDEGTVPSGRIRGRLRAADGSPLTGRVRATSWRATDGPYLDPTWIPEGETDLGGSFELGPLPPGRYGLSARVYGRGFVQFTSVTLEEAEALEVGDLVVLESGTLELTVPDPGFRSLLVIGNGNFRHHSVSPSMRLDLPPGLYRICLWGDGVAVEERSVEVRSQDVTPIAIGSRPGTHCRFEAYLSERLAGQRVSVALYNEQGRHIAHSFVLPDSSTLVQTYCLAPGNYRLAFRAGPTCSAEIPVTVTGDELELFDSCFLD